MKAFLKENFVLVLGISLPVILILILMIAQSMTKMIPLPQYSAVFAVQQHPHPFDFDISDNGHLVITYEEPEEERRNNYDNSATIIIFDASEDTTTDFKILAPKDLKEDEKKTLETPENLKKLTLNTAKESADGYVFEEYHRSGGSSMFTDIFGYNRRYYRYALRKDGHHIPIPNTRGYYGHETFIGWVEND